MIEKSGIIPGVGDFFVFLEVGVFLLGGFEWGVTILCWGLGVGV